MAFMLQTPIHQQYGRIVAFFLFSDGRFAGFPQSIVILPINPEDFSLNRPERVSVVQTLGDPFVDEFGTGLATISIRGTTGWRTRITLANKIGVGVLSTLSAYGSMPGVGLVDGYEGYRMLHREVFDEYFRARKALVDWGRDPDQVSLILVNTVDNLAFEVIPENFRLMRSKSRPLLYQYDINFVVKEDLSENPYYKYAMAGLDIAQTLLTNFDSQSSILDALGSNFI